MNTLIELRGHISAIHASSLFHLFDEEKQLELGKRLAALLDPCPGSITFGSQGGMPVKGQPSGTFKKMLCHSPESYTEMWEEQIFKKGQVKVNAVLRELNVVVEKESAVSAENRTKFQWLSWSVERL